MSILTGRFLTSICWTPDERREIALSCPDDRYAVNQRQLRAEAILASVNRRRVENAQQGENVTARAALCDHG
jgi:hypothetical protein